MEDIEVKSFPIDEKTYLFLYEVWFAFAEELFNRVVQVSSLNKEQEKALRKVALRINDFEIVSG